MATLHRWAPRNRSHHGCSDTHFTSLTVPQMGLFKSAGGHIRIGLYSRDSASSRSQIGPPTPFILITIIQTGAMGHIHDTHRLRNVRH